MDKNMFTTVKYTEHREQFTLTRPISGRPRVVRISLTDNNATDSSSDEDESVTRHPRRVKKYVKEIKIKQIDNRKNIKKLEMANKRFRGVRQRPVGKWTAEIRDTVKRAAVRLRGAHTTANFVTKRGQGSLASPNSVLSDKTVSAVLPHQLLCDEDNIMVFSQKKTPSHSNEGKSVFSQFFNIQRIGQSTPSDAPQESCCDEGKTVFSQKVRSQPLRKCPPSDTIHGLCCNEGKMVFSLETPLPCQQVEQTLPPNEFGDLVKSAHYDMEFSSGLFGLDDLTWNFFEDMLINDRVFAQDVFFDSSNGIGFGQAMGYMDDYLKFQDIGDLFGPDPLLAT